MRATMTPQQVADHFISKFGSQVSDVSVREWAEGSKRVKTHSVWMRTHRENIVDVIRELTTIDYPHLGVISAVDCGETIELLYYMQIFFGGKHEEIQMVFTVPVPKNDPHVPTITEIIPGAVYTEREKQDMIGVIVDGIPDNRRIFLPDDFPDSIYPWRKDEKGIPDSMIKELWRVGRPEGRPSPAVKVIEKPDKTAEIPAESLTSAENPSDDKKTGENDE